MRSRFAPMTACRSVVLLLAWVGLLAACVARPGAIRAVPSEPARGTLGISDAGQSSPSPNAVGLPTPPPVLYLAHNRLVQLQSDGATRTIADLSDEGAVMTAIAAEDSVFVLREGGLQRVDLMTGKQRIAVRFHQRPLFGELVWAPLHDALLYSTALEWACSPTGMGASLGLYEVTTDEGTVILVTDKGYVRPLGLAADQRSLYALPVGCDPEFDEFWEIPIGTAVATTSLPTWDAVAKEYGHQYAALSPDAGALAFTSSRYVQSENTLRYRLSVYDLHTLTIERYDLPSPPSHIYGGLVWSNDSRSLYFAIDAGAPEEEPSRPYGLWALNAQGHSISRIADLSEPAMHLLRISSDDLWLLLAPERQDTVTWVYLPAGERTVLELPQDGVDAIVR